MIFAYFCTRTYRYILRPFIHNDIRRRLLATLLTAALAAVLPLSAAGKFTLVIDAGHGGHDAGALGAVSKEKDINLRVALAFGRLVEQNCADVKVVYTRKTDVFVPLMERANIANRCRADLFISVHTNALPKGKIARGFETYTLGMHRAKDNLDVAMRENAVIVQEKNYRQTYQGFNPNSSESYIIFELMQGAYMERSVELATMIQKSVCATAQRPNKGVHQAGFLVLRETSMPSCLIELGFITTPDEERALADISQTNLIAQGIYKAFVQYKDKYKDGAAATTGDTPHHQPDAADAMPTVTMPDTKDTPAAEDAEPQPQAQPTARRKSLRAQDADRPQTRAADRPRTKEPQATARQNTRQTAQQANGQATRQANGQTAQAAEDGSAPVFKIQIFTGDRKLREGDDHFKGLSGCQSFEEGGLVKYTYGASTDYNEIYRLRKDILEKFPGCFIIAFRNGQKMDISEGIREFKQNKNKKK